MGYSSADREAAKSSLILAIGELGHLGFKVANVCIGNVMERRRQIFISLAMLPVFTGGMSKDVEVCCGRLTLHSEDGDSLVFSEDASSLVFGIESQISSQPTHWTDTALDIHYARHFGSLK